MMSLEDVSIFAQSTISPLPQDLPRQQLATLVLVSGRG